MPRARSKQKKADYAVSSFPSRQRGEGFGIYRLVSAVGMLVIIGLLVIIAFQYLRQHRVSRELAEVEALVVEHQARQVAMETEIERLQDMNYIEILARIRLGLVKPGEVIFQLED